MKTFRRRKATSSVTKTTATATTSDEQPIKKHKYNAKKVEIDGVVFDSKDEADYYTEVVIPGLQSGEILTVDFHPKYVLVPKFERDLNGAKRKFQPMTYSADFRLELADHTIRLIDIKGMVTSDFKIKYKLFNYLYEDLHLILLRPKRAKKQIVAWEEVKV